MKDHVRLATPCGAYCPECHFLGDNCPGCPTLKGRPFWGQCRYYDCVREQGVQHCGECSKFPCDYFLETYDPDHGQWSVFYRLGQLVYRRKIGTRAWVEEKEAGGNPPPKRPGEAGQDPAD